MSKEEAKKKGLCAVVVGATGAIGKEVVNELLVRDEIASVVTLTRRTGGFTASAKLTERKVDFDNLKEDDFKGADTVFCCLGTTIRTAGSKDAFKKVDYTYIVNIARYAKVAGVKHFALVSSVGADAKSYNFYLQVKGLCEDQLKKENFDDYSVYRPSVLDAERSGRCGERTAVCCLRYIWCCFFKCCCPQYDVISVRTVALAMVKNAARSTPGYHLYDGSAAIEELARSDQRTRHT